jgi:phage RecT family recombinase
MADNDQRTRQGRAAAAADARRAAETAAPDGEPGAELVPVDPLRQTLDRFAPEVARALPKLIDSDAFMRVVLTGLKSSKQAAALAQCDRPSLFAALLEAARLGLMPFTNEAAIIPFGKTATFVPMYQGYVQLFYRTGQVASVVPQLIRRGDAWDLSYGDQGGFYHRPALVDGDGEPIQRGPAILAYCYLAMRDGSRTMVTTVDRWEAEDVMRNHSRSWQLAERKWTESGGRKGRDSAWHTNFDDMWLKTAIRRHTKIAPMSPELVQLLMVEDRDDRKRYRDAPMPPPIPVVEGIDWTRDVDGTVTGEVLPDDERDDGERDDGERREQREHVTITGAAAPAGNGGGHQAARPGAPLINPRTTGQLNWKFNQAGWAGDDYRDRRIAVAGILGNLAGPPLPITAIAQLTDEQGRAIIAWFDGELLPKAAGDKAKSAAVLQGIYDHRGELATGQPPGDVDDDRPPPPDEPGR